MLLLYYVYRLEKAEMTAQAEMSTNRLDKPLVAPPKIKSLDINDPNLPDEVQNLELYNEDLQVGSHCFIQPLD